MPVLFSIETDAVRLVWSCRKAGAPVGAPVGAPPRVEALASGIEAVVEGSGCLLEQTGYTVLVQSRLGRRLRLRHRDPVLFEGLHGTADVVHGMVNFGGQVGESRFVVEVDGRPHVAVTVEVFPAKLDYRADYEALRDEVEAMATGLVYEYLRATYQPAGRHPAGTPGPVAWVTLLRHLLDDLTRALDEVARHPWRETRRTVRVQRAERIRRPDATLRKALATGGGRGRALPGDTPLRERMPSQAACTTLDTAAHRWLAAQLNLIRTRLSTFLATTRPAGPRGPRVRAELAAMLRRVARLADREPFRDVRGGAPRTPPFQLHRAPGYREAYQACLCLRDGLTLSGGALGLGVKDLHLLYEYWCFLTVVRLAGAATGRPLSAALWPAVERKGLRLGLRRGQTLVFPLAEGGRLTCTYNPRFSGPGYLVPQQPDILLALERPDGRCDRYVLDAKYRLDASPGYRRRYGVPGPPTGALNDLHRYRDAILDPARTGRSVVEAVALYPYREETPGAFAASRHARLLREVGVGALPLLPGATEYLAAWLAERLAG